MAVTKKNSNVMAIFAFIYRMIEVFESYFTTLEEESIRDNFVIIYELLDEIMDFGYPQHTEAKVLKEFICVTESHRLVNALPPAITNAVSWRAEGIVYDYFELFK